MASVQDAATAVPLAMLIGCKPQLRLLVPGSQQLNRRRGQKHSPWNAGVAERGICQGTDTKETTCLVFTCDFIGQVAQRAIRKVARDIFEHLHQLDLRFHLERQTGALSRVIDRGSRYDLVDARDASCSRPPYALSSLVSRMQALSACAVAVTRSINFVLSAMVFNVAPTILEIGMVSGILGMQCGSEYAAITVATLTAYTAFTIGITQWR